MTQEGPLPPETVGELARSTSRELRELRARIDTLFPVNVRPLVDPGPIADAVRTMANTLGGISTSLGTMSERVTRLEQHDEEHGKLISEVEGAFKLVGRLQMVLVLLFLGAMALGATIVLHGGHVG